MLIQTEQVPQSKQEKKLKAPTSQSKSRQSSNPKEKSTKVSETPSSKKKKLEDNLNEVSPVVKESQTPTDAMDVDKQLSDSEYERDFAPHNSTLTDIVVGPSYSKRSRDSMVAKLAAQIAALQAQCDALAEKPAKPKEQSIRVQQNIPAYKGKRKYDIFKDDMPSYKDWLQREFDKFPESPERSRKAFIRDTLKSSSDRAMELYFQRNPDGSVDELLEEIFRKASESRQTSIQSSALWYTLINRVNQDVDKLSNTDYTSHCGSNLAKALQLANRDEHPMVYKMAAGGMVSGASGTASSAHLNDAPKSILTKAFTEFTKAAQDKADATGIPIDHSILFDDMVSLQNQLRYDPYHRMNHHSDSDDNAGHYRGDRKKLRKDPYNKERNSYNKERTQRDRDRRPTPKGYDSAPSGKEFESGRSKQPTLDSRKPNPALQGAKREICQFFLKKSCKWGDKCNKQH